MNATDMNATETRKPKRPSRTRIMFDLKDVLNASEIESFEAKATAAGAKSLTDHFLNVTIRKPLPGSR